MILKNKKGVGAYLAWVLLMAFMVSLSTFVYFWMTGHVEEQTEQMTERSDKNNCDFVSLTTKGFCQDENLLYLNLTNSKDLRIRGLKFQLFDIYDEPMETEINISISPSATEFLQMIKHGTLSQVEIIPIVYKNNREISCESSKILLNNIEFC